MKMEAETEKMSSAMWIVTVRGDHFEQEVERQSMHRVLTAEGSR